MKTNKLFEDVFMDIDWSLYDDETADLTGLEEKIHRDAYCTYKPANREELVSNIFEHIESNNFDLNDIDVSLITDMSELFSNINYVCEYSYGQTLKQLDISGWNMRNVVNAACMFFNCDELEVDVSKWDVKNLQIARCMFFGCKKFQSNLENWDVRRIVDANQMFYDCKSFNCDLSKWDVRNVKNMESMFEGCTSLCTDFSNWKIKKNTRMSSMLKDVERVKAERAKWPKLPGHAHLPKTEFEYLLF